MQQVKLFFVLLIMTLTALFIACKKEEKNNTASKTDILTTGSWRMTAYTLTPPYDLDNDGIPDADGLAVREACEKDNLFFFKKDGTLTIDEGPTKCTSFDPQIKQTTTWSFANNETAMIIDGQQASILELTQMRLRVKVPVVSSIGDITFTKQ